MARLVAFIQEWNGRHEGDGVYLDEPAAASLIERGIAMDAYEYRKKIETEKTKKAPEAPKKDKMVRAPKKKK